MVKNLIPWRKKTEELSPSRREDNTFEALHRQMNELFDGFFQGFGEKPGRLPALPNLTGRRDMAAPRFEVSETDSEVRVKAELPGMDEKDIEVTLDENVLTIRGEKKAEREEKKRDYYVSELSYGQFHRSIPLPAGIDRDQAKARFKKGTLTLTLPKTEQARQQQKHIDISTE